MYGLNVLLSDKREFDGEIADLPRRAPPPLSPNRSGSNTPPLIPLPNGGAISPQLIDVVNGLSKDDAAVRLKVVEMMFQQDKPIVGPFDNLPTALISRISALMVVIFIIQILVTFARFFFKESGRYYAYADAMLVAEGDPAKFTKIMLDLRDLDFGKSPASPFSSALDTAKSAMSGEARNEAKNRAAAAKAKPSGTDNTE